MSAGGDMGFEDLTVVVRSVKPVRINLSPTKSDLPVSNESLIVITQGSCPPANSTGSESDTVGTEDGPGPAGMHEANEAKDIIGRGR